VDVDEVSLYRYKNNNLSVRRGLVVKMVICHPSGWAPACGQLMYIVRTHFATQGHEHCNMMPDPYSCTTTKETEHSCRIQSHDSVAFHPKIVRPIKLGIAVFNTSRLTLLLVCRSLIEKLDRTSIMSRCCSSLDHMVDGAVLGRCRSFFD
jgi:hypothetical protein